MGKFSYMDLRGDSSSGKVSQPGQVSRLVRMIGEEATPVFRRVTMAFWRSVVPQSSRAAPYNTETPIVPPAYHGPVRTPLRRPVPTRMEATVAGPEPSPQTPVIEIGHAL